jgi:hypothetical protein
MADEMQGQTFARIRNARTDGPAEAANTRCGSDLIIALREARSCSGLRPDSG